MRVSLLILLFHLAGWIALAQYPPETIWTPAAGIDLTAPGYLERVHDGNLNLDYIRISDPDVFGFPAGAGELTHQYAKIQAWNADMSKVFIGYTNVLNADDYSLYKQISYPGGYFTDARWSHIDPGTRYFCWGEDFLKINIETDEVTVLHHFPGYEATIGPWEGNITADDRYVVITHSAGDRASIYDIENDTVLATRNFGGNGFDWASFTPWGDYVAVSNDETGHVELYDLGFNYLRDLAANQEHADFAIDTAGNEVLVQVIPLSMTRLDNGQWTDLLRDSEVCGWDHHNPNISGHISGRCFDSPGWAIVSTPVYECGNGDGYYSATEIFAIKLDTSQTIRHFGHSRASGVASIATVSPDGKKVIFQSDWALFGSGGGNTLSYAIEYNEESCISYEQIVSASHLWLNPHSILQLVLMVNGRCLLNQQ